MNVATRLAAFLAGLAVVFGLAFVAGRALGPEVEAEAHDDDGHGTAPAGHEESAYALRLGRTEVPAGVDRTVTFRVVDAQGNAVTAYDERHERDLHLIVVAESDLTDFQHVHPGLGRSGVWSVRLDLAPGTYRVYADTQPTGADPLVLQGRLRATGGEQVREPLPAPTSATRIGRYAVTLGAEEGRVTFSVSLDGRPVTDLQPYLGAYGHLVVIREDDLAYLHAHPEEGAAGPEVAFEVELGDAGRHALYLDFKHRGVVRTAIFTLDEAGSAEPDEEGHDDH